MFTLPQLIEEDIQLLDGALNELIAKCEASLALVIDKGGFVVNRRGPNDQIDGTTLAALAAASFAATQAIANLINEPDFSSIYQQGEKSSMLVSNINEQCVLVVIFETYISVGVVRYYAATTVRQIDDQLHRAQDRSPETGVDLSILNLADPSIVFKRRRA
jgi:predicted regulator of Ras-like GTPase activity (Roadblock/LC7/MglB family)